MRDAGIHSLVIFFSEASVLKRYTTKSGDFVELGVSYKFTIMKTMTCKQLGGACDTAFHANTFEQIADMSKNHGMEMIHKGDEPHIKAMQNMQELMNSPDTMKEWFENRKKEFEELSEESLV